MQIMKSSSWAGLVFHCMLNCKMTRLNQELKSRVVKLITLSHFDNEIVKIVFKGLNSPFPNSFNFWEN